MGRPPKQLPKGVPSALEKLTDRQADILVWVFQLGSGEPAGNLKVNPVVERPAVVESGRGGVENTSAGTGSSASEVSADGPMVRAVRWLEQRLRGRGSSS